MTFSGGPVTGTGTLTLAGTLAVANGGTGTATAFTAGSVVFAGASGVYTQDNANLFWDNTNDRLGIGTATPTQRLHVRQDQDGTTSALIQNRNGSGTPVSAVQFISGAFDLSDNRYAMISSAGGSNTTLQFWTGEGVTPTEKMRVSANGNVGIGTATPEAVLDVNGSQVTRGDASGFVYFAPKIGTSPFGANYDRFEIRVDPSTQVTLLGNVNGGTGSARALAFLAGTNERMRITAAGDVGIGTTAPTTIFHVEQNNASNVGMRMRQLSTTQFAGAGLLCNGPAGSSTQGGTAFYHFNLNTGGTQGAAAISQFDETGAFQRTLAQYNYHTQSWGFYTNGTERLAITSAGRVGIGTASPAVSLDVVGGIRARGGAPGALGVNNNGYAFDANGDTDGGMFSSADGQLEFYTNATEKMRIDSSGNVGIGTTSPGYRLDIASGDTTAGLGYAMRLRSNATATAAAIQFTTSTVSTQNGLIACTDTGGMTIQTDGASSVLAFRTNGSERLRILNTGGITSGDLADAVGYKGVPQNAQASAYTLALSDMGKHISITTGGVVIPANGAVAFPIGSTIVVYNDSGSAQNISITTDTLRLAGTATTGTRSLAQRGLATCVKVAATEWVVTGNVT
jgi:hypothetical protein